jgi:hypothetical protein
MFKVTVFTDKDDPNGKHELSPFELWQWPELCMEIQLGPRSKPAGSRLQKTSQVYVSLLLLLWRYSPGWALASITIRLQASRSLALSLHSFIRIFLRSVDTSSSHLVFGHLPWLQHGLNIPCAKCPVRDSRLLSPSSFIHYVPRLIVSFHNK